ncbi:MAG: KamA family radical SAM protein [Planctomycetota bacterium]|jgi:L-lysine 2,3-aminomutase
MTHAPETPSGKARPAAPVHPGWLQLSRAAGPLRGATPVAPRVERYRPFTRSNLGALHQWRDLDPDLREAIVVVSLVLPFRTNQYVVDRLIDWRRVPDDPIFQLTFPQRGMLKPDEYAEVRDLVRDGADKRTLDTVVNRIRLELNPHPNGQVTHNVPLLDGTPLRGVQHKYRETLLFFPRHAQTCHAYCTFCFRWAQFAGFADLKFASGEVDQLARYLRRHEEVTDVLITGGDPAVMSTALWRRYVEPILHVDSVRTIRIGTKAPAYWPQRFVTDPDADELLRLFERIVAAGKHLAVMCHYTHPVELSTGIAQEAIRRIRGAGATMRMQGPLVRHVNDDPEAWVTMWRAGVQLGVVPYYMFVERNTGPWHYFRLPLVRCWEIFRSAYQRVSGLGRTVRGPSMSCFPGKCHILGVTEVGGHRAFVLQLLQARDPGLVRRPFFARYDPRATWYDDLEPLTAADRPFFPAGAGEPAAPACGQ